MNIGALKQQKNIYLMMLEKWKTNSDHELIIYKVEKKIKVENLKMLDKKKEEMNSKKLSINLLIDKILNMKINIKLLRGKLN